jgi:7,8-dihydro-6-hydroxymethylpterin dimethyltransferase
VLLVNKRTKQVVPIAELLDLEALLKDAQEIADAGLGRGPTLAALALSLVRNFRAERAPEGYSFGELFRQFQSQIGATGERIGESEGDAGKFEWRFLFVAGMWFQDLFNYDFRRTEMCIIPYGTQMGEVSFCAYNTGAGFRQIVEKMKRTATVAEWFKTRGRHPVYAKNQELPLPDAALDIVLRAPEATQREATYRAATKRRLPLVST